jgi:hypothetical protein
MHNLTILTLALALLPLSVSASGSFNAYAIGTTSCGTYIQETKYDPVARAQYSWWIAGYITSANVEKSRHTEIDQQALDAWAQQYCTAHPLDPFLNAAIQLNLELDHR